MKFKPYLSRTGNISSNIFSYLLCKFFFSCGNHHNPFLWRLPQLALNTVIQSFVFSYSYPIGISLNCIPSFGTQGVVQLIIDRCNLIDCCEAMFPFKQHKICSLCTQPHHSVLACNLTRFCEKWRVMSPNGRPENLVSLSIQLGKYMYVGSENRYKKEREREKTVVCGNVENTKYTQ